MRKAIALLFGSHDNIPASVWIYLRRQLAPEEKIQVTIILPEGRQLAERTSNAAFSVVEGLSLLGTTGISQPLSAPGHRESRGGRGRRGAGGAQPPYRQGRGLKPGRLEILTAHCATLGLPTSVLQKVFVSTTAEAALQYLRELEASEGGNWVNSVYGAIASTIDSRSQDYIRKHSEQEVRVGSVLFDRDRQIIVKSKTGAALLSHLC